MKGASRSSATPVRVMLLAIISSWAHACGHYTRVAGTLARSLHYLLRILRGTAAGLYSAMWTKRVLPHMRSMFVRSQ